MYEQSAHAGTVGKQYYFRSGYGNEVRDTLSNLHVHAYGNVLTY